MALNDKGRDITRLQRPAARYREYCISFACLWQTRVLPFFGRKLDRFRVKGKEINHPDEAEGWEWYPLGCTYKLGWYPPLRRLAIKANRFDVRVH